MALPRNLAALGLFTLAFQAIAACNSVMGIEPAEHDPALDETALMCHWPAREPREDCSACDEGCGCADEIDACLKDDDCRDGLKRYRKCAGKACRDGSGLCNGCAPNNEATRNLVSCMNACGCSVAQAASLCQSYCACMNSRCEGMAPGGAEGCVDTCLLGQLGAGFNGAFEMPPPNWLVYCYWKHCEMAVGGGKALHCGHAIGKEQASVCPEPPDAPTAALCGFPQGYAPSPCNTNADCCGSCRTDVGVCVD